MKPCRYIYLPIAIIVTTAITIASCSSITKFVPIQMARVPQTEAFEQIFTLQDTAHTPNWLFEGLAVVQPPSKDTYMDAVFSRLIGRRNWQHLKDLYVVENLPKEIESGDIFMRGSINLVMYLHPINHKKFVVEGFGRFFIIRKNNKEILLSGDFHVIPERHDISEFEQGFLLLNNEFFVSRIPARTTYYWKSSIAIRVALDTRLKGDKIYALDYNAEHHVYLLYDGGADSNTEDASVLIGTLTFEKKNHMSKFIDLRGIQFMEDDYKKKLINFEDVSEK